MEYRKFYPEGKAFKVTTELKTAIKNALLGSLAHTIEPVEIDRYVTLTPVFSFIDVSEFGGGVNHVVEIHSAKISSLFSDQNDPFPVELEFVRDLVYKDDYSKDLMKPFSLFVKFSDGTRLEIGMIGDNLESAMSKGTHTFRDIFTQGVDLYNLLVKPDRKLTIYSSDPSKDGKFKSGIKSV